MAQAYAALVALDLMMGGRAMWSPENPGKEDSYSYRREMGGGGGRERDLGHSLCFSSN